MPQLLLIPDPRPLVERFGVNFFRNAPQSPGVYLMRDAADTVLYVGKAKNLRRRLGSYRVANPQRLPRRHLRLLRQVNRIELEECTDESAALARESELLRALRPRFNRAGTWPGTPRFLTWRLTEEGLQLKVAVEVDANWLSYGPLGAGVLPLRCVLVRLLWGALHPGRGLFGMPPGWFEGYLGPIVMIPRHAAVGADFGHASTVLQQLFTGNPNPFVEWIGQRTANQAHACEVAVREADLETVMLIKPDLK